MKIGCLLINNSNKQFWFLCGRCESSTRPSAIEPHYKFIEVYAHQFPEWAKQGCFTCDAEFGTGSVELFESGNQNAQYLFTISAEF